MIRIVVTFIVLAGAILAPCPALSHHSNVAYEVTKVITITGVVKDFEWVNPHTWLHVIVDDGKGGKVEWACEGRAPGILGRAGWTRNSLKAGAAVSRQGNEVVSRPASAVRHLAPHSPRRCRMARRGDRRTRRRSHLSTWP